MDRTVWCVFQKLPDERCPSLAAVCGSREVAQQVVQLSEEQERMQGVAVPSEWTLGEWSVLQGEVGEIQDIQQMSHILDPQREGVLEPTGPDAESGGSAA